MLNILRAGLMTSVQDRGRHGWRQYGISLSGAWMSLQCARPTCWSATRKTARCWRLCSASSKRSFAATAGCADRRQLQRRTGWSAGVDRLAPAVKRAVLSLSMPTRGMRSYLAVNGGFAIDAMLARSTDLKAAFGGWQGRKLQDGDQLPLGKPTRRFSHQAGVRQLLWGNRIRALPGPEYNEFTHDAQDAFWRNPWQLSPQSNRMGYRLQGSPLQRSAARELLSHGLVPGVVQVPPNGQPIVLMADAQTTGGYPRIACVIEADLYQLAQIRLGEPIHFIRCTLEEALLAKQQQQRSLDQIARGLAHEDRS